MGSNARVIKWNLDNPDTFPVKFSIDNGPLGELTQEEGANLVRQAFQRWVDLLSSTIAFNDLGLLEMDLTGDSMDAGYYKTFFEGQKRTENPVVFDSDGSIIDDVLGDGSKDSVLGFAGIRFIDPDTLEFESAWVVLNGLKASQFGDFPKAVAHEIGHFIGLDHTQIKTRFEFTPLMYPFVLPGGPDKPLRDDTAWVSWLYPEADFRTTTGTITGRIFRRSGGFFPGANVVAVKVTQNQDQTLTESREEIVSVVSDFLFTSDGSYELPGLMPGDYVVFIEPLNSFFVGGSGVGPFESRFTGFVKDYYNADNESGTDSDDPTEKVVITVGAGQTVPNIDLISNDPVNRLDLLSDDSEIIFEFPAGFSFPFFGNVYTKLVVNSDGNLTFGVGDSASTPRDESRFLSGPPRIAPLFTDLDPSKAGEVTATAQNGRITFTWEDVPEFTITGTRPGNKFSVTLFLNGDILLRYDTVEVTPDPDNVQAVVGISPGSLSVSSAIDLSSQGGLARMAGASIYEVFQATSFDLTGQEILFQAAANELFFPFYRGDAENFSGYAITNFSSQATVIQVEGRGSDGNLLNFPNNPQPEQIGSQSQLAKLGSEFFGIDFVVPQSGWIRMTSDTPELASFFQFGNGLTGSLTKMDGSVAFTGQSQLLFFTRIFDGLATFPTFDVEGPKDAQTFLSIANPNNQEITLTLKLFGSTGQPFASDVTRTLPALGRLFEQVSSIFNIFTPLSDGFVRVDVQGPGAVGFALIELEDALLGVNASFGNDQNTLYSAQLANGTSNGSSVFTSLKLVNTANERRVVTLTAFREDGSIINLVPNVVLDPNVSLQRSVHQLFGFGSPILSQVTTGSIQIDADGPGIIGDVVFGEPARIDFAAALSLQTTRFTRAIFSQVANGATNPSDPSTDSFTGIALFNPNMQSAQVTITVFDRDGNQVGQKSLTLGRNQRLSDLVENLIPETADLIRGYIVIDSTQPVVAQQLFGNNTLQFLSAVPPRIIE
ncbi:matrixin family metalloprotease [Acidobacteria bacterium AH-259-G07]|nr:matrixin family metalloprotease [Acidobacteria bacterium AH-259-G07]